VILRLAAAAIDLHPGDAQRTEMKTSGVCMGDELARPSDPCAFRRPSIPPTRARDP